MKFRKCLKHAFEMVIHSKLRSWLTIIGIVIGVAAVIAIMSLGQGLQQEFENQLSLEQLAIQQSNAEVALMKAAARGLPRLLG